MAAKNERKILRLTAIATALCVSAGVGVAHGAAVSRTIPLFGVDTLMAPASAPMRYKFTGKSNDIHFVGRFALTGAFHYGCEYECDSGGAFELFIVPDADQQKRLPRWTRRGGEIRVWIRAKRRLVAAIITRRQMALLRAGKIPAVSGHVSIIAKDYTASVECDAPTYYATFVSLAEPARVARARLDDSGC